MLGTMLTLLGGIGVFTFVLLLSTLLDRRWGRGHLGVKPSTAYQLSETEIIARRNNTIGSFATRAVTKAT